MLVRIVAAPPLTTKGTLCGLAVGSLEDWTCAEWLAILSVALFAMSKMPLAICTQKYAKVMGRSQSYQSVCQFERQLMIRWGPMPIVRGEMSWEAMVNSQNSQHSSKITCIMHLGRQSTALEKQRTHQVARWRHGETRTPEYDRTVNL